MIPEGNVQEREKQDSSFFSETENEEQNNSVGNTNTLPTIEAQVQTSPTPTYNLNQLLSYEPPKPNIDPNRPEELRKRALHSSIAKGLNLVGDVVALGRGANVNRRQPDNSEANYMNQMYQYIDDSNKRMDNYEWQKYMAKLRAGQLGLNQYNADRSYSSNEAWRKTQAKRWEKQDANRERWTDAQIDNMLADNELNIDKAKIDAAYKNMTANERERHNRQMELAALLRAERTGKSSTKEPFKIFDDKGNKIELEGSEREKLLTLILTDPNIQMTEDDIDLLRPKYGEPVSTNSMNILVQKYWHRSPSTKDYLDKRYGGTQPHSDAQTGVPGINYSTPETSELPKPEQQQEKQYSTAGYY